MEKRTLYAVVAAVVLGLGAFAAMRSAEKGERKGPAPRPFAVLKASDIAQLDITTPKDEKTTLVRKDGSWRVVQPKDWPADAQAVKTLTEALERVTFGDIVTENAGKHAELGVADTGATRLKVAAAGQTIEMLLGQTVGGFTMVRLAGKNEVWQASNLFPYQANKTPKDWRDHTVLQLNAAEVDKLTVEVPGGSKLALERAIEPAKEGAPAKPGEWKRTSSSGDAPGEADVLDPSQATTVIQALATMRAADFADGKSAKDAGLEPPALVLTVAAKGKTHTVEMSGPQGEDYHVRVAGEPTIFVVKKYLAERAAARPIDYRDKTLVKLKADELARVTIVQGKDQTILERKGGKWQLGGGGAADEQKVKTLLGGLESLVGSSFVTDRALKTELERPRATVTIEPQSGKKITLKIGGLTKDSGDYYAALEGSRDVLLVKKFAIDRLLKKPADLQAGGANAAAKK